MPAFVALSDLSAAANQDVSQLGKDYSLLVTVDFARTVKRTSISDASDVYQRAVQQILTSASRGSSKAKYTIVISLYEVQRLFSKIRRSSTVVLHIYKLRWNIGYRLLDYLNFFTILLLREPRVLPLSLATQLNLFASQLYFDSLQDYLRTCNFLGLAIEESQAGCVVSANGFILQDARGRIRAASRLLKSPVLFFRELFRLRKNSKGINRTHIGRILDGNILPLPELDIR